MKSNMKTNTCPIHKKSDNQIINNNRPVFLLPIRGKLFQRLIFNSLFNYLEENKILSTHQPSFCYNELSVNQLTAIVLIIYTGFDTNPAIETLEVFLDFFYAILYKITHSKYKITTTKYYALEVPGKRKIQLKQ